MLYYYYYYYYYYYKWTPVNTDEVEKLIGSSSCKTCQLDPVPTWLVKDMKALLSPFITLLCNKSSSSSSTRHVVE